MDGYQRRKKFKKFIVNVFLVCLIAGMCFAILYPVLKLLPTVFCDLEDLGNPNVIWIPIKRSVISFKAAFRMMMKQGWMTYVYSIGYAGVIMCIQIFMSAMVGYALARVKFRGNNLVFFLIIFTFLVPPQALLLSQYIHFKHFDVFGLFTLFTGSDIDMINRPVTLFLQAIFGFGVSQSLFIFIFRQFFLGVPKELEEASLIDGCGFYRTYGRIMLPNAKPAISTVAVLSFVWNYGDIYYTNYFNADGPYLSVILKTTFQSSNKQFVLNALKNWYRLPTVTDFAFDAVKQAGALLYLIPLLIVYFIAQKWLVENLENSGIVG